jgi:acetoacetyl-CoA reductase/3-oxoacyl-[acyl-carrier protein] reductase
MFEGRVAIVTGGGRGIGRAIAEALAARGAAVHVFDREVGKPVAGMVMHALDIRDSAQVTEAVTALDRPPTLLVNNAGITRDRSIARMSDEDWETVLSVNLTGAFKLIRAVAAPMTQAGFGRIVNIASINGLRGKFGQANYAASKGGLIALTKTAARELGPKGVTVNAIAPGMVLTDMVRGLPQEVRDRAAAESVLPVLPEVGDVAAAALFLLSDAARCITGQVLQVDSGQYI